MKKKVCKHKWRFYSFDGNVMGRNDLTIKAICGKCLEKKYL